MAIAVVVYAVSFLPHRLLSRYRELAADRGRRDPHRAAIGPRPGADQDLWRHGPDPVPGSACRRAVHAFFVVPAVTGKMDLGAVSRRTRRWRSAWNSWPYLRRARPRLSVGLFDLAPRPQQQAQPNLDALSPTGAALTPWRRLPTSNPPAVAGVLPRSRRRSLRRESRRRSRSCSAAPSRGDPRHLGYTPGCSVRRSPDDTAGLVTDLHAVKLHSGVGRLRTEPCCARRWGFAPEPGSRWCWCICTSGGRSIRSRRSTPTPSAATRRWSCRCALWLPQTYRSKATLPGGSRCGARRVCSRQWLPLAMFPSTRAFPSDTRTLFFAAASARRRLAGDHAPQVQRQATATIHPMTPTRCRQSSPLQPESWLTTPDSPEGHACWLPGDPHR